MPVESRKLFWETMGDTPHHLGTVHQAVDIPSRRHKFEAPRATALGGVSKPLAYFGKLNFHSSRASCCSSDGCPFCQFNHGARDWNRKASRRTPLFGVAWAVPALLPRPAQGNNSGPLHYRAAPGSAPKRQPPTAGACGMAGESIRIRSGQSGGRRHIGCLKAE